MVPAEPGLQRNSRTCLAKHLFRPEYPATKAHNPSLHCLPVRCKPCEILLAQKKHAFTWICGFPQQDQVFQCCKNPLDWKTKNTHLNCSAHNDFPVYNFCVTPRRKTTSGSPWKPCLHASHQRTGRHFRQTLNKLYAEATAIAREAVTHLQSWLEQPRQVRAPRHR